MDKSVLKAKQVGELREIAEALQLTGYKSLKKADLIDLIAAGGAAANGDAGDDASADDGSDDEASDDDRGQSRGTADQGAGQDAMTSADRIRARRRGGSSQGDDTSDSGDDDSSGRIERQRTREDRSDRDRSSQGQDTSNDSSRDRDDSGRGPSHDDNDDDGGQGRSRSRNRNRNKRGGRGQDINFDELEVRQGVLDLLPEGYGFLRTTGYLAGERDVYVSQAFVRRNQLRRGDVLAGPIRYNKGNDKFPALARIDTIEGVEVEQDGRPEPRPDFKDLTPVHPAERLSLDLGADTPVALRITDLLAPIGKGQRAIVIGGPRSGKSTFLRDVARAIEANNPEVHLMVLLVDERPEEVTEFERAIEGEVISSTIDRPAEDHGQAAELTIERAKRIVERGRDVVVLADSLNALGRAYNLSTQASGRMLAGGLDAAALHPMKRFIGAARNVDEGGSLTIVATAVDDPATTIDVTLLAELAGIGNTEIRIGSHLDTTNVFPAVEVAGTSTLRDELLMDGDELELVKTLRAALAALDAEAARAVLTEKVEATESNATLLKAVAKSGL